MVVVDRRDGRFWIENIPLPDGTSTLSVTATDAWNNRSITSLSLTRSTFGLTIDVDQGQLGQAQMSVGGSIGDPNYTVRINGVPAANYGNGSWFAATVPVSAGGVATFDVCAYPPNHDGEPASALSLNADVDKPFRIYVANHSYSLSDNWKRHLDFYWNQDGIRVS
jgi:hypothetical protein